ncbi:MAG: tRNA (adenosine(37)-N6)-threonylcarbamoyltransferase complex transferase subunit TsaD [Ignavibacteriaceae bacterium]|nr:tRNA (adenosine(37)-N6)-threonylcarbamoyltransferase complex transferase subunit TsaD [Ignavibacteriaceae bacterium]
MVVLGIESSCDETSIAILKDGELKANLISSQDFHKLYGGVVPELSSRAHIQRLQPLIKGALQKAELEKSDIDVITATAGPGLIGALLTGFIYGKHLAYALDKPFIPVNHIEGHIFSGFLMEEKPEYPFLALVVSGGHTMLVIVNSETEMKILGSTIDDAVGEAFDKVAKMLGLPYPGGPSIQKAADRGNEDAYKLPISETAGRYDFSYSGLKTAVLRLINKIKPTDGELDDQTKFDIAASFQRAAVEALLRKTKKALNAFPVKTLCLTGGVAANKMLREGIQKLGEKNSVKVVIPAFEYCGDNAAMIALRGEMLYNAGESFPDEFEPFPEFYSKYLVTD